jgi:outer membrane protein TolC
MTKAFRRAPIAMWVCLLPVFLGACSIAPVRLTDDEQLDLTRTARDRARTGVEPLTAPLTLSDAVARAMKYNLDHRMRMMEEAQALGVLEIGKFDMLPKLLVSAGYNNRNNDNVSRNINQQTGQITPGGPFISSDRSVLTSDLGLQWNLLDFGVSYYNAKQNADRVMIAAERRRKVMHQLIQDVRTAFWRAASAEKLAGSLAETIDTAEKALADASKAEAQSIRNPLESLRYQRSLLENIRLLESVQQELSTARIELANLINLPQGQTYTIAEPKDNELFPDLMKLPIEKMEELALANNADLREQSYSRRIALVETKKAMMKLFPGITFGSTRKYTDNSFTINRKWTEASMQVNFNLFNLLSAKSILKQADVDLELADHRRMTVQMAILTQVHLAKQQYEGTYSLFTRADSIYKVDERIFKQTQNRAEAKTLSELERVSGSTSAILSLLRRYQALSQVYAAASRVQASLGLEPQVGSLAEMSLQDLSIAVGDSMQQWARLDRVPTNRAAAGQSPVIEAPVSAPAPALGREASITEPAMGQEPAAPAGMVSDAAPAVVFEPVLSSQAPAAGEASASGAADGNTEPASMGLAPMGFHVSPQKMAKDKPRAPAQAASTAKPATGNWPTVSVTGASTTWTFSTGR